MIDSPPVGAVLRRAGGLPPGPGPSGHAEAAPILFGPGTPPDKRGIPAEIARPDPPCPDLRALAEAHGWRWEWDPARQGREEDPWLVRIPCLRGMIYPHGRDMLTGYTESPRIGRRLLALPACRLHRRGEFETEALFRPGDLLAVAGVLRPRKSRRLGAEQKARLIEALAPYRFRSRVASPHP